MQVKALAEVEFHAMFHEAATRGWDGADYANWRDLV